ncbi:MAG: ATP-dependent carboxylate-amine ligase [Chitinophagaceae bacterium]
MTGKKVHVLMTGAGAPGAAGIIRCLQEADWIQLTVADADEAAVGRHLCNDFVLIPKANDTNFVEALLTICRQKEIYVVLPLITRELFPLARNKHLFEKKGIKVLVSSFDAIEIANNKSTCYQFLQKQGIAIPKFFVVKTVEEFIHAAFELDHPQKSFVFKPSIANGSRGVRIVSDSIDESEQLFNNKPYNLFITYAHALKILSSKSFPELLLSEYLPGDEYSVDCIADEGNVRLIVPRIRQKMINGISVQGQFINDERIREYCTQIIKAIGLHGNVGIQVKMSKDNLPLLLEINPRVQGTIVAGLGAGINLPLLAIKQALQLSIYENEWQVRWETSFSRYWSEVFY